MIATHFPRSDISLCRVRVCVCVCLVWSRMSLCSRVVESNMMEREMNDGDAAATRQYNSDGGGDAC